MCPIDISSFTRNLEISKKIVYERIIKEKTKHITTMFNKASICRYKITNIFRKTWGPKTFLFFNGTTAQWHVSLKKDLRQGGTSADLIPFILNANNPVDARFIGCHGN